MITTVTLNLSIDRAYSLRGTVKLGEVMRVEKCTPTAGGKGLNVARIIKQCGEKVLATGFAGGHMGALAERLMEKQEIPHAFVPVKNETRCCINVLAEDGTSTEFLEPGAGVDAKEVEAFLEKFEETARESDVITLSGSVPPGAGKDIYRNLTALAAKYDKPVILDTSGDYLAEGCRARPFLVKPNKEELEALLGIKLQTDSSIVQAARELQKLGAQNVLVSLGKRGAVLVCESEVYFGTPPAIKVANTVGCGDSMVGAFAVATFRKKAMRDCLADAIAVSAANAMNTNTGSFLQKDLEQIQKEVKVWKMEKE